MKCQKKEKRKKEQFSGLQVQTLEPDNLGSALHFRMNLTAVRL